MKALRKWSFEYFIFIFFNVKHITTHLILEHYSVFKFRITLNALKNKENQNKL